MFPNIINGSKGFKIERKSLNQVIDNLSADELKRLQNLVMNTSTYDLLQMAQQIQLKQNSI